MPQKRIAAVVPKVSPIQGRVRRLATGNQMLRSHKKSCVEASWDLRLAYSPNNQLSETMDPELSLQGLQAFILAKNESANILRGVLALEQFGATVTILDSGSTDGTLEMIAQRSSATVISYDYRDHATAY